MAECSPIRVFYVETLPSVFHSSLNMDDMTFFAVRFSHLYNASLFIMIIIDVCLVSGKDPLLSVRYFQSDQVG